MDSGDAERFAACLARARAGAPSDVAGFFGPDSAVWRAVREPAVPLAGQRAVLLQLARPAIAAAGVQASDFRSDFVGRTARTFAGTYGVIFGDRASAEAIATHVFRLHARVAGVIAPAQSPRHAGTPYRGLEVEPLAWVLATMIESTLRSLELLAVPLGSLEAESFYVDMRRMGLLFAVPWDALPEDLPSFEAWFAAELASDRLHVGDTARMLSTFLFGDGWNLGGPDVIMAAGVLPERFRADFGLPWGPGVRASFRGMTSALGGVLRRTPGPLRWLPAWHQAMARVGRPTGRWTTVIDRLGRGRALPFGLQPRP